MGPILKRDRGLGRLGRVSRNAAVLLGSKIVTAGLSFFLIIAINRELGPYLGGIFAFAYALYSIFMIVPDFGLGNISVRDVSQDNSKINYYFKNVVALRIILATGAFLVLVATDFLGAVLRSPISFDMKFWTLFAVAFCLLLEQPISNSLAENFIALEKMGTVALVYFNMAVIRVGLSLYILSSMGKHGGHPVGTPMLVLLVLVYILTLIYSIIHFAITYHRVLKRDIFPEADKRDLALGEAIVQSPDMAEGAPPAEALVADSSYSSMMEEGISKPAIPKPEIGSNLKIGPLELDTVLWRYLLRTAWPLLVIVAGVTFYVYIDVPLLSWIRGDTEVGYYNAGTMFARSAIYISMGLNMAVLPAVSKVAKKQAGKLGELWERLLRYMFTVGALMAVLVPILVRPVLIVQQHNFLKTWPVVWISMAAITFSSLSAVTFPFYIAVDRQKKATIVVFIGIALKLILLPVAIPLLGYTGAAITLLTTETINFFLYYKMLSPELKHRFRWLHTFWAPVFSTMTAYAFAFILQWFLLHGNVSANRLMPSALYAVISTAAVAVVFAGLLLVTGVARKKGFVEINELLKAE